MTFGGNLKGALCGGSLAADAGVGTSSGRRSRQHDGRRSLAFLILVPLIHLFGEDGHADVSGDDQVGLGHGRQGNSQQLHPLYWGGAVATGGFIAWPAEVFHILFALRRWTRSLKAGAELGIAPPHRSKISQ